VTRWSTNAARGGARWPEVLTPDAWLAQVASGTARRTSELATATASAEAGGQRSDLQSFLTPLGWAAAERDSYKPALTEVLRRVASSYGGHRQSSLREGENGLTFLPNHPKLSPPSHLPQPPTTGSPPGNARRIDAAWPSQARQGLRTTSTASIGVRTPSPTRRWRSPHESIPPEPAGAEEDRGAGRGARFREGWRSRTRSRRRSGCLGQRSCSCPSPYPWKPVARRVIRNAGSRRSSGRLSKRPGSAGRTASRLEEDVGAVCPIPDHLVLLVVLDEQPIGRHAVPVDDHAGVPDVVGPADPVAMGPARQAQNVIRITCELSDHDAGGRPAWLLPRPMRKKTSATRVGPPRAAVPLPGRLPTCEQHRETTGPASKSPGQPPPADACHLHRGRCPSPAPRWKAEPEDDRVRARDVDGLVQRVGRPGVRIRSFPWASAALIAAGRVAGGGDEEPLDRDRAVAGRPAARPRRPTETALRRRERTRCPRPEPACRNGTSSGPGWPPASCTARRAELLRRRSTSARGTPGFHTALVSAVQPAEGLCGSGTAGWLPFEHGAAGELRVGDEAAAGVAGLRAIDPPAEVSPVDLHPSQPVRPEAPRIRLFARMGASLVAGKLIVRFDSERQKLFSRGCSRRRRPGVRPEAHWLEGVDGAVDDDVPRPRPPRPATVV